jgi:hypothetical protein
MPFGGGGSYRGKTYAVHGEPAGGRWQLLAADRAGRIASLSLTMKTRVDAGRVTKKLQLVDGENVVYVQHSLEGFSGRFPLGHHATLAMPPEDETVRVSVSPFQLGMTNPAPLGQPGGDEGEYHSLAVGRRFRSLRRVPLIWGDRPVGDCSTFPTRPGFTDILAVFRKPTVRRAWTAAVFERERFVWFSLKDAAVLPATAMWISNRGRHGAPWNGRNCCLGLEDVCAYFAEPIGASVRPNPVSKLGIPTAVALGRTRPTLVNYIEGVAKLPRGFRRVRTVRFAPGRATFVCKTGKEATVPVQHEFLKTGEVG